MLTEQRKQFILEYLKLHCKNQTQAAINAGYSPKTAAQQSSDILKKPEVIEFLKEQKSKLEADLREEFIFAASDAFKVMKAIMNNPTAADRDRLAAARDFLDRAGFKPIDKQEISGEVGIALVVDDEVAHD